MIWHECECCGGSLDPGEGRVCDECQEKQDAQKQNRILINQMIRSTDYKQMSMEDYLK